MLKHGKQHARKDDLYQQIYIFAAAKMTLKGHGTGAVFKMTSGAV